MKFFSPPVLRLRALSCYPTHRAMYQEFAAMIEERANNVNGGRARGLVAAALLAALTAGCAGLGELFAPSVPGVTSEWAALLHEIRAYERRIGFVNTDNFVDLSREQDEYPFCGYASRLTLPYSYEDPAIQWLDTA